MRGISKITAKSGVLLVSKLDRPVVSVWLLGQEQIKWFVPCYLEGGTVTKPKNAIHFQTTLRKGDAPKGLREGN